MQNVTNTLLNFLLVSIPEEIFLVVMTLIFMKRFDLLDIRMWKQNLKWIMIPSIPMALDINITKYIFQLPKIISSLSSLIIFIVVFIYMIKRNSYSFEISDLKRIFLSIFLSFMILGLLESLTVPLIIFLTHKSLLYMTQNVLWNFILSIPSRIMELILIVFLIIKHNNVVKIKLFDAITKNKFLLVSTISFAVIFNILAVYSIKLIGYDRILENKIPISEQIIISTGVMVIPSVIIVWMLLLINYLLTKEKQIQQTYENLIEKDDVMTDVDD